MYLLNHPIFLYLASPSLEVREPGEPEVCIQLVRGGVERPPHCGRARRRGRPAQLLQLLRVLDSVHPVTLDGVLLLLLVDPALLVHHVLLLIRHHDRSINRVARVEKEEGCLSCLLGWTLQVRGTFQSGDEKAEDEMNDGIDALKREHK